MIRIGPFAATPSSALSVNKGLPLSLRLSLLPRSSPSKRFQPFDFRVESIVIAAEDESRSRTLQAPGFFGAWTSKMKPKSEKDSVVTIDLSSAFDFPV